MVGIFSKAWSFIGENGIDFETEISEVIHVLDEAINTIKSGRELKEVLKKKHKILINVHNASKGSMQKAFKDDVTLTDFAVFSDTELG